MTPVAAAVNKRPDSEMGTSATPGRAALTASGLAASKGAVATTVAVPAAGSDSRPNSDRTTAAAAAAAGASQEMEALRQRNAALEKEVGQLKAALADAKREAEQWREEFDGLSKAVAGVAQRMAKKP